MALRSGFTVSLWAAAMAHRVSEVFDATDELEVGNVDAHSAKLVTNSTVQGCTKYGCGPGKSGPAWEAQINGVLCRGMDLGQYTDLASDGGCLDKAIAGGEKKADLNCYKCDVNLQGPDRAKSSGQCKAKVVCSGARATQPGPSGLQEYCSNQEEDHTRLGLIAGLNTNAEERRNNPDHVCKPCPSSCDFCEIDGQCSSLMSGTYRVKCLNRPVGRDRTTEMPDSKYTCTEPEFRKCNSRSEWYGLFHGNCRTTDRKTYCDWLPTHAYGALAKFAEPDFDTMLTLRASAFGGSKAEIGKHQPDFTSLKKQTEAYGAARAQEQYRIDFTGLKCADFQPTGSGFVETDAVRECFQKARAQGLKLAQGANCALCDFRFYVLADGTCVASDATPFKGSNFWSAASGQFVACSRLESDYTCYGDKGALGELGDFPVGDQTNSKCLPCPEECKLPGTLGSSYTCTKYSPFRKHSTGRSNNRISNKFTEFTCKMEGKLVTTEHDGRKKTVNDRTRPDQNPSNPPYTCGEEIQRSCNAWGSTKFGGCKKSDWNTVCQYPANFGDHDEDALEEHRDYEVKFWMDRKGEFTSGFDLFSDF